MNKITVIYSDRNDAAYNMALEEFIMEKYTQDIENTYILFFWQNNKAVIIGRNQNARNECNMEYLLENNIQLVRRKTGGGAVFHDMGNLNYSFMHPKKEQDISRTMKVLCTALGKFNIPAEYTGRNDLEAYGKKVSGNAFRSNEKLSLHHGTFLLDLDIKTMVNSLNVSKDKLEPKGIESVKSRVINLKELNSKINVEGLERALVEEFEKEYCCDEIIEKRHMLLDKDEQDVLDKMVSTYRSKEWTMGQHYNFNKVNKKKYSWGSLEIRLLIEKEVICNIGIYSDSLEPEVIRDVEKALINTYYEERILIEKIEQLKCKYNNADVNDMLQDVLELLA